MTEESMSGLGGEESQERMMCKQVRICAEIGEGCLCPDNPIAPAMWGIPPEPKGPFQIGSIELLQQRIYSLDPATADQPHRTEVIVGPGKYPIFREGISTWWMMSGRVNVGHIHRLGDGIVTVMPFDMEGSIAVTFPSFIYGPDEWDALLVSPVAVEDHPEQRLRIDLDEE